MEGIGEEVIASDRPGNSELRGKGCDFPMKLEDRNALDLPVMCESSRSDWPESSTNVYIDSSSAVDNDSSRCVVSLPGSQPSQASPSPVNEVGNVIELTVGNYRSANLSLVSSSANLRGGKWQHYVSEMPAEINYKAFGGLHDTKEIFACLKTSERRIISSCIPANGDTPKTLPVSSSSQILVNKALKGKGAVSKDGDAPIVFSSTVPGLGDGRLTNARKIASDALMRSSIRRNQLSSHRSDGSGLDSLHHGINLRDWLKPGCRRRNKVESLFIFRQIVEMLDSAHSQGVALKDLRPSCFVLLPSSRVVFSGSTAKRESARTVFHDLVKKRPMEQDANTGGTSVAKQQKLNKSVESVGQQFHFASTCDRRAVAGDGVEFRATGAQDSRHVELLPQNPSNYLSSCMKIRQQQSLSLPVQLEEKWYRSPEQLSDGSSTFASNIYSLGVLLFELLCWFESHEMRSTLMLDLRRRMLPSSFLSEHPKEAGFCLWFLLPEPSSRPTARQILQCELICRSQELGSGNDASTCPENANAESDLLLHFLNLLEEQKQAHATKLIEDIECLDQDIKEIEKRHLLRISSVFSGRENKIDVGTSPVAISRSVSNKNEARLMRNINQIGNAYFSMRSQICSTAAATRSDKNFLKNQEGLSAFHNDNEDSIMVQKSEDPLGAFFEGFCKFARYSKFEVCGSLKNRDLLSSTNVLCALSFDRDEEYIAVAGVSKKIKVFEFETLLNESMDIHYPVVEMSNKAKLSCVSWNNYIKNYLASTDYDGVIQMWDAGTGQGLFQYAEHQKRAWSVNFSHADPMMFASGSDDCSVKLWSINERGSLGTIWNPANICCVQFSASANHLLAFGSADYKIYCYDTRHTKIPWCTLAGHEKAVSYVKFLDSEALVSASTDNTLKLWDLNRTSSTGLSSSACSVTFGGHTNQKNFVGLSTMDGYIACGSETNEVCCYYRSLPMPITSYKFGNFDPFSGNKMDDDSGQFVSSVCWRQKSNMVVAANSMGNMRVLKLV